MQLGGNRRWVPLQTGKGKHSSPEPLCLICNELKQRDQNKAGSGDEKEQHFSTSLVCK